MLETEALLLDLLQHRTVLPEFARDPSYAERDELLLKKPLGVLNERLIPLTQGQLYVVCLKPGALKAAPIRSGERWGADARWRSFSKNFPTRRAALCFFRHDGGRTGLFVPHAAEDALLP